MELIYKIAFGDEIDAIFTINKKYIFNFESGFGYYVKDDAGKVLFMNKDVVFKHFMFKSS